MGLQTGKIESQSGDRKSATKHWLKNQSARKMRRFNNEEIPSKKLVLKGYEL